ncbi:MAG: hypothetical protein KF865_02475 [Bdellovibrionaceae bacterium]|nr:hypothetical protein [Pseudobdellovibrionaceae bacterium]
MKNKSGFGLIGFLLFLAVLLPVYFIGSMTFVTKTADTRAQARQRLRVQEVFNNVAVLLRQSYDQARRGGCTGFAIQTTSGNINICPPTMDRCVANVDYPNNNLCLQNGATNLRFITKNEYELRDRWWVKALEMTVVNEARAQSAPSPSLPNLPTSPPVFTRPGAAIPARLCNGTDLICVIIRICLDQAVCSDRDAFYQRIGFVP